MANKNFSVLIYFLSTILVLMLSIFVYRIITHISYDNFPDKITVSKFTIVRVPNIYPRVMLNEYYTPLLPSFDFSKVLSQTK